MSKVPDILGGIRPEVKFCGSPDFFLEGLLDSFDLVTLVSELDREYNIHIDGTEILPENFRNIEAIEALLKRYGAGL